MSIIKPMGKQTKNQEGMVAIIVATIIMIILALITLGFARLMSREQRQAQDRSLSTQAFYAAESGVNDVAKAVHSGTLKTDRSVCNPATGTPGDNVFSGTIDAGLSSAYSCLLVVQDPPTLEYTNDSIDVNASKIVAVRDAAGDKISKINFAWEGSAETTGGAVTCATPSLPASGNWPFNTGMLRVDIVPADILDRVTLTSKTITLFLYPMRQGCGVNTIAYGTNSADNTKGRIVAVNCQTKPYSDDRSRSCELGITMTGSEQNRLYYLRMRSVYKPTNITVRMFDTGGNQIAIKDAQVQVDVTGKVNDVIRRIQVRIPVKITFPVPESALESTNSICKLIGIAPPDAPDTSSCPQ